MIAALLLLTQAAEPADACDDPRSPQAMYECSAQDFERAQAEVEAQWKQTSSVLRDRDARDGGPSDDRLSYNNAALASQLSWLDYRDAQCAAEGAAVGRPSGRSIEVTLELQCKTSLTQLRIQELRELAADAENN